MRQRILDAAYELSIEQGFRNVIKETIATRANVATGSVNHHFKTMPLLRDAVMTRAVEEEQLSIILTGLVDHNPIATAAPDELKRRAIATLS